VIVRLLTFIRLPESSHQAMLEHANTIYAKFMTAYESHIKNLSMSRSNSHLAG
jgi:hypothetical protein